LQPPAVAHLEFGEGGSTKGARFEERGAVRDGLRRGGVPLSPGKGSGQGVMLCFSPYFVLIFGSK